MRFGTRSVLIFLLMVLVAAASPAQHAKHQQGAKTSPQMCPMGQGGMSMMQMMDMMQTMHPAIAIDNTGIYVVRGNQVVKLDKNSLQVIATGALPEPPAGRMHGMGGMQGMGMATPGSTGGAGMPGMMQRPDMQSMMNSMSQLPPSQFDQMFLQQMMQHHSGAIAMSRLAVTKATHPELRRFARGVISSQSRQNKQFSIWLKDWYQTSTRPMAMPMDEDMVSQLRGLSGRDFEIQYMQMMISHHQEGVHMASMAEQKALHPELKTAATKIVSSQSAEIVKLRGWLSAWYGVEQ